MMAVSSLDFTAQVDDFVRKTKERMTGVFRESSQRVISTMQEPAGAGGNMPVDTGFLRASLVVSTDELAGIDHSARPDKDRKYNFNDGGVVTVIAGAEIGETIYAGYTASYAGHQEYGTSKTQGRGFVRGAAAQWQQIVTKVTAELKDRIG